MMDNFSPPHFLFATADKVWQWQTLLSIPCSL